MTDAKTVYRDDGCIIYSDVVGDLEVNCYFIVERTSKKCWIVDPGGDAETIIGHIKKLDINPTAIINTHGHADHIGANKEVSESLEIPIWAPEGDALMLTDAWKNLSAAYGPPIVSPPAHRFLLDAELIELGKLSFSVHHVPGHTIGEIMLYRPNVALVGDVLFAQSVGRTDLPGGNSIELWQSISKKILILPDSTIVLPGHGPTTTVGEERRFNPFLMNDGLMLREGTF